MSRSELDHLSDHDLILLLHERLSVHIEQHNWRSATFRWAVLALIAAVAAIVNWHPWKP